MDSDYDYSALNYRCSKNHLKNGRKKKNVESKIF